MAAVLLLCEKKTRLRMKVVLLIVTSCLLVHTGHGAPASAVYQFVKCNPEGDKANCVTQQSPEMAWSPDLPARLPASTAQYLEAWPVEDEEEEEEESAEFPESLLREDGTSDYEGSTGSGEYSTEEGVEKSKDTWGIRRVLDVLDEVEPDAQELKEDHLLL